MDTGKKKEKRDTVSRKIVEAVVKVTMRAQRGRNILTLVFGDKEQIAIGYFQIQLDGILRYRIFRFYYWLLILVAPTIIPFFKIMFHMRLSSVS